jgi:hypothetical protein
MCEIFLLWGLGRHLAEKARMKGHTPAGYVVILVVLWIVGEVLGFCVGLFLATGGGRGMSQEPNGFLIWGLGILGAAVGAAISFGIVALLPDYGGAHQLGYPYPRSRNRYDEPYNRYADAPDYRQDQYRRSDPPPTRDEGFTRREERWDKGDKWDKSDKWE